MSRLIKLFGTVSRAEFILPNLGSLIMGLAWGATPASDLVSLTILVVLSFTIINLSSAIGAQINTYSDYELDSRDSRKKQLVQALDSFGRSRLKKVLVAEFLITLVLVISFAMIYGKPLLLGLWLVGIFLGWAYSAPPLRVKGRSWLAPVTLILVLGVFPVFFAYGAFASAVDVLFLVSLAGLALTIYGVIVPTEIRDYFGDRAMGIETVTVHLGLVKASLLSITLLTLGATFTAAAFLLEFLYRQSPLLAISLLAIAGAVVFVLGRLWKLHLLSMEYMHSEGQYSVSEAIMELSAHNPQWIMLVTQTYSAISVLLLIAKFLI